MIAVIIKSSKSKADAPQPPDTIVTSAYLPPETPISDNPFRLPL
ncbi:hypothetical protein [Nocardia seriolae]|nr:hypothetical protein [Nocardia seriolae]BAW09513.1 hypothetical protein NSERUTF1_6435 [Nocardia seriolae]